VKAILDTNEYETGVTVTKSQTSGDTSKPASRGHLKTGQL
jgi:hypothetical protein